MYHRAARVGHCDTNSMMLLTLQFGHTHTQVTPGCFVWSMLYPSALLYVLSRLRPQNPSRCSSQPCRRPRAAPMTTFEHVPSVIARHTLTLPTPNPNPGHYCHIAKQWVLRRHQVSPKYQGLHGSRRGSPRDGQRRGEHLGGGIPGRVPPGQQARSKRDGECNAINHAAKERAAGLLRMCLQTHGTCSMSSTIKCKFAYTSAISNYETTGTATACSTLVLICCCCHTDVGRASAK